MPNSTQKAPAKPKQPRPKGGRKPVLHFEILRRIAETASGMRYENLWFEVTGGPDAKVKVHRHKVEEKHDTVVIPCRQWPRPPGIPEVTHAHIAADDRVIDLLNVPVPVEGMQGWERPVTHRADAVFWSAAAVEKFLVPYYASAYGDLAAKCVEQLQSIFVPPGSPELDGNGMITGSASVSSLPTNLATPEVGIESSVPADDTPFAVVHLPSSEYAAEGLEDGLPRLFTLHRSGKVKKI